jgi:hypothetical protein
LKIFKKNPTNSSIFLKFSKTPQIPRFLKFSKKKLSNSEIIKNFQKNPTNPSNLNQKTIQTNSQLKMQIKSLKSIRQKKARKKITFGFSRIHYTKKKTEKKIKK